MRVDNTFELLEALPTAQPKKQIVSADRRGTVRIEGEWWKCNVLSSTAEDSQRIHRGPTEDLQRTHRGPTAGSQRTRRGLAENHRGLTEDLQRTHRGSAEDSQRTHSWVTEDWQRTGVTEDP